MDFILDFVFLILDLDLRFEEFKSRIQNQKSMI